MCGEVPSVAPDSAIQSLKSRERRGVIEIDDIFEFGQKVMAKSGAFSEVVGKFVGVSASGRIRVLHEILGRSSVAEYDAGTIVAA